MAHDGVRENPYTQALAKFVSGLRYDDIPEDVRQRIKLLILDSLGCALYGVRLEWTKILLKTLQSVDRTDDGCRLWGMKKRLSAPNAALLNGTMVQGFELDDVHRKGVLHVGAVTLPALIAVTELKKRKLTGKDFLTAAVAGYEIGPRVGICMGQEHIGQGWHSGATLGVFSAAAGAAAGLGLSTEQTVHALGIAGTQSAGLMAAQYGAMVKRMHAGKSSQSGLYGALLAANGFTGIIDVLESEYGGFCTTFSRSQDRFDLKELTAGFGSVWQTMGVALKFYSCVGSNHTTLDAIRDMQAEKPFGATDVKRIDVHGSQVTMDHVGWKYVPQGLTSAQLNLPYCIATWLLDGDCFVDQFTDDKVADPARMKLSEIVHVHHDDAITKLGAKMRHKVRVQVELNDGKRMERTVESARGSEYKFASESDIVEKFEKLAIKALPKAQVEQLRDAMLGLDQLADATQIAQWLGKK
jgi:2-methylcitrate dehydratase PrpD